MKNATLRQLTVFETVAEHLHFTRAAETLGTTQPSVSIQVKQLEENLGVTLFEQLGKRIYLTEAGAEMYRYCRNISQHLAEAEAVLERLRGGKGGRLNLVMGHTSKYFIPSLLAAFRRQYAEVSAQIEVAGRVTLLSRLADNSCDMVIMGSPPDDQDLVSSAFLQDPLVMVSTVEHPLAKERHIALNKIAHEAFLVRESSSDTRKVFDDFLEQQAVTISPYMVINSNEAIKCAVRAGLGLAVVPLHSVTLEVETKRLAILDIADMNLKRSWFLVHRQGKRFSRVAEAFKDFIIQEAEQRMQKNSTTLHPLQ